MWAGVCLLGLSDLAMNGGPLDVQYTYTNFFNQHVFPALDSQKWYVL